MKKIFGLALFVLLVAFGATEGMAAEGRTWSIDRELGSPDAPNVVIEYSSLTCSHCAAFNQKVFPKLQSEWINAGKLRWIVRDFPLDHLALAAAVVSHAAGDSYFAFEKAYFRSQRNWATADNPLAAIKAIARMGGMSDADFDAAIRNQALITEITQRKDEGEKLYGIDGTPTFIINGVRYTGDLEYESFVKLLKE